MKKIFLVAVLICLVVSSCSQEEVIKIGWVGPLTGPAAILGIDGVVAAQIAVDEINADGGINGKEIILIVEDDKYKADLSVTAYQKLVDIDKVDVIFLGTYSSIFALSDRIKEDNIIAMDSVDCNSIIAGLNDNMFCLSTDTESVAEVIARAVNQNKEKKVGILFYNSDLWMPTAKDYLKNYLESEVVLEEAYTGEAKDFRTIIRKLMEKDADALILLGYDEKGIAMKQARELGFQGQFYTTGTVTSPTLKEASLGAVNGTIHSLWDAPKDKPQTIKFIEEFKRRQNRVPILDFATYPTYDAMKAIALAIKDTGTTEADALRISLLNVDFEGITGDVKFLEDGSVRIHESIHQYFDGNHISLE